ncbi:PREDICTED: uncharacterized protein LOC109583215 [Amphimedon queenslandica]|uniref:Uncharacterized protein n=1 Tax=Amphimedon queenslandica TaxID=400682 RepID=A0AAN0JAE2_AMPQE|nr:PREDICTED: uncharacterized protein LOC109583215 [Amphimedon queenslandica]|eukprot:XP_019854025.1 PREDICTED: uncharacterized protein LOC109583215 [Amphimedon queenslandica]
MQQRQSACHDDVLSSSFRRVKSAYKNHSSLSKSSPVPLPISLNGASLTKAELSRHPSLPVARNRSSPSSVSFTSGESTGSTCTTLASDASTSGSTVNRRSSRRLSGSEVLPAIKQEQDCVTSSGPGGSLPTIQHHLSSYSSRIASKSFWSTDMLMDREREMSEIHSTNSLPSINNDFCTGATTSKPTSTSRMIELKHSKSDIHLETRDLSHIMLKGTTKSRKQNQTMSTAAVSVKSKRRISLQHLPPMY